MPTIDFDPYNKLAAMRGEYARLLQHKNDLARLTTDIVAAAEDALHQEHTARYLAGRGNLSDDTLAKLQEIVERAKR